MTLRAMAAVSSYAGLAARPIWSPEILASRLRKKSRPLRPISSSVTEAPLRAFDDVGVEGARQALVAGNHNQQNALLLAAGKKRIRVLLFVRRHGRGHVTQYLAQQRRVGTRRDHPILRTPQFGRGDHLHGLGNLLRVLDRADAPADVDQARHGAVPLVAPLQNGP